jgi:hypothetical protein
MLVPYGDPHYANIRPNIAIPCCSFLQAPKWGRARTSPQSAHLIPYFLIIITFLDSISYYKIEKLFIKIWKVEIRVIWLTIQSLPNQLNNWKMFTLLKFQLQYEKSIWVY